MNSLFLLFLTCISTILISDLKTIFLGIILFAYILVKIIKYKLFSKKLVVILCILITFFVLKILISHLNLNNFVNDSLFLVIKKSKNYIIVGNIFKKYYVYGSFNDLKSFDLIKVSGELYDYKFKTTESSFSFSEYLINLGCYKALKYNKINIILQNRINFGDYKEIILSSFNNERVKNIASMMLFDSFDYETIDYNSLNKLNLLSILSLSGIFLEFIFKFFTNIIEYFIDEKKSFIIANLLLMPLYILNLNNFCIWRFIVFKTVSYINRTFFDNFLNKLEILSITSLFFIIVDYNYVFQSRFYISVLIKFFMCFSDLLIQKYNKHKSIIRKLIIYIILIPFIIFDSGEINFINILISPIIIEIFKPLFVIFYGSFFRLFPTFIEGIIVSILDILAKISKFNALSLLIGESSIIKYVLYYLMIIAVFYFAEIGWKAIFKKVLVVDFVIAISSIIPFENMFFNQVYFINVDQGDSALIINNGKGILIDTGGLSYKDIATECLIPFLKKKNLYRLEAVFISHNDFDHCGALDSLKENYFIENIYTNESNFPIKIGDLIFDNLNVYHFSEDENDKSLVLNVSISNNNFLFMGDATKEVEKMIVKDNPELSCDILKVGHHGSKTSTSEEFIKKIKPKEAIISCGYNNIYNHPHEDIIKLLEKYNVKIRRTDIDGTIKYKFWAL